MKKTFMFIALLLLFTTTAFATETEKSVPVRNYYEERVGYTGSDFFNGLDLPLIVGASYTPNQLQTAGFITSMCLEWRWHKTYSWYVPITIDTHNANYSQLKLPNSNILSGTVWYTEAHIGVGYRVPVVKDIVSFYEKPYRQAVDFYFSVQPGLSIPTIKNVQLAAPEDYAAVGAVEASEPLYSTPDAAFTCVPSMKFTAGFEWFVDPRLCLFAQAMYIQHLTPTVIEQAAISQSLASAPTGPLMFCVGLSTFFF